MPKGGSRGKSGLHRARITGNARRRRLQEKCNRDIPPRLNGGARVERRGKSSPAGWEQSGAVNSIRSNTAEGTLACPAVPGRWLEPVGNGRRRQMTAADTD